jgi:hypothetical protein
MGREVIGMDTAQSIGLILLFVACVAIYFFGNEIRQLTSRHGKEEDTEIFDVENVVYTETNNQTSKPVKQIEITSETNGEEIANIWFENGTFKTVSNLDVLASFRMLDTRRNYMITLHKADRKLMVRLIGELQDLLANRDDALTTARAEPLETAKNIQKSLTEINKEFARAYSGGGFGGVGGYSPYSGLGGYGRYGSGLLNNNPPNAGGDLE